MIRFSFDGVSVVCAGFVVFEGWVDPVPGCANDDSAGGPEAA